MLAYINRHNSEVLVRTDEHGQVSDTGRAWGVMVNLEAEHVSAPGVFDSLLYRNHYSGFNKADASNPLVQKALRLIGELGETR